jgi:hypothetical protein
MFHVKHYFSDKKQINLKRGEVDGESNSNSKSKRWGWCASVKDTRVLFKRIRIRERSYWLTD